jgi:hypothetical protein
LSAACSFGKCPRCRTPRRNRAFQRIRALWSCRRFAELCGELEERYELGPGLLPRSDRRLASLTRHERTDRSG